MTNRAAPEEPPSRRLLRRIYRGMRRWGFDARAFRSAWVESPAYRRDLRAFRALSVAEPDTAAFPAGERWPVYGDRSDQGGVASGAYFHQDLFVARQIHARHPDRHVDVGSRVDGFVAHVASFRDVEVLDIRPVDAKVPGITFVQADLMNLGTEWHSVTDSVSCLHALEHLGLGRYGDPVDPEGWRRGLAGLTAMLVDGGTLYLSVPTGRQQRVEFNAHRVFSVPFLAEVLTESFDIEQLAFVDDAGDLHASVALDSSEAQTSFGAVMGCSIWILRKRPAA